MSSTKAIRRRNRSMQLSVESCEERIVPVAPVVGKAFSLIGEYAVGKVLDVITGSGDSAEFRQINEKLDKLSAQVGQLKVSLDNLQVNLDRNTLYQITQKLNISKIDHYWEYFNLIIDDKLAKKTIDKNSLETLAKQIIDDLGTTVGDFKSAFKGGGESSDPLMKAYSNVIKNTYKNKVNGSDRNGPFLDSNYSTAMVQGFDYYTSEGVKAAILLANAYTYLKDPGLANLVRTTLPTPYAKGEAKQVWDNQVKSLPSQMIPDYIVVDTGTNRAWSQFNIVARQFEPMDKNGGYYSWDHYTWPYVKELENVENYLNGKLGSNAPKLHIAESTKAVIAAKHAQEKSGIQFHWHLPTKIDVGNQPEFYTSRGFSAAYSNAVWTNESPLGVSKSKPGAVRGEYLDFYADAQAVFYAPIKNHVFYV